MSRQPCTLCNLIPQNILILFCQHNLCLQCAVSCLFVDEKIIVCQRCKEVTELDDQIVKQLIKNWTERKKNQSLERNKNQKSLWKGRSTKSFQKSAAETLGHSTKSILLHEKQEKKYQCKYHPEFQFLYICETCENNFICPECAIHGQHHGHQVSTVKSYLKKACFELEEDSKELECKIKNLQTKRRDVEKEYERRLEQIEELKSNAKEKYRIIYENLQKEEEKIISECDNLINWYTKDFQNIQLEAIEQFKSLSFHQHRIQEIISPLYCQTIDRKQELKIVQNFLSYKKQNPTCINIKNAELCADGQIEELTHRVEEIERDQPTKERIERDRRIPLKEKSEQSRKQEKVKMKMKEGIQNQNFFVF